MVDVAAGVIVSACGTERAEDVHRLTQLAFAPQASLDPPSGAVRETLERVIADLASGGGAVACLDQTAVGCLRWLALQPRQFHVRRLAVDPRLHRRGIGATLMTWAEDEARRRGFDYIAVGVRAALPSNRAFYDGRGYRVVAEHRHDGYDRTTWLGLEKDLRTPGY